MKIVIGKIFIFIYFFFKSNHFVFAISRPDIMLIFHFAIFQFSLSPTLPNFKHSSIFANFGDIIISGDAVIGDDVSMLQDVTLGGTGKEDGDRHPKIRNGVLIGAGAKILGNIEVGHCSRIAAGSVVLKSVPNNVTVAGVPAKVIGEAPCAEPSRMMDQMFSEI